MLDNLISNLKELWRLFLRPYRHQYSSSDLGPDRFFIEGEVFVRKDFSIRNKKGLLLQASYFCPLRSPQKRPFVVYCHCNSGSRVEALQYAKPLLMNGFGLCCFDFSGSGCSEGEFVTLGYYEADDIHIIVKVLKESGLADDIYLWGRSMGAVSSIKYVLQYRDNHISGLVLDSPYCNLHDLAIEIAQSSIKLPKFLLDPIIGSIDKDITKMAAFSLKQMDIAALLRKQGAQGKPAYFLTSLKDSVVDPYHVEELKKLWGKEGVLKYIAAKHYENREETVVSACIKFLKDNLSVKRRSESFSGDQHFFHRPIMNFSEISKQPATRIKMFRK